MLCHVYRQMFTPVLSKITNMREFINSSLLPAKVPFFFLLALKELTHILLRGLPIFGLLENTHEMISCQLYILRKILCRFENYQNDLR